MINPRYGPGRRPPYVPESARYVEWPAEHRRRHPVRRAVGFIVAAVALAAGFVAVVFLITVA